MCLENWINLFFFFLHWWVLSSNRKLCWMEEDKEVRHWSNVCNQRNYCKEMRCSAHSHMHIRCGLYSCNTALALRPLEVTPQIDSWRPEGQLTEGRFFSRHGELSSFYIYLVVWMWRQVSWRPRSPESKQPNHAAVSLTLMVALLQHTRLMASQVGRSNRLWRTSSSSSRLVRWPSPFSVLRLIWSGDRFLANLWSMKNDVCSFQKWIIVQLFIVKQVVTILNPKGWFLNLR